MNPGASVVTKLNRDLRRVSEGYKATRLPSWQPPGIAEAVTAQFADDDVVQQLDAEDCAGLADPFGQLSVFPAGCRIS